MNRPAPTPFDDNQLQTLLGMAGEADVLARAHAGAPAARPTGWSVRSRAMLAAAALAIVSGLVALWMLTPGAPQQIAHGGSAPKVVSPVIPAVPASRGAVVLAISQSDTGELQCVRWSPPQWGERTLAEVSTEELQTVGLSMVCDSTASHVMVVGMQGPTSHLPASDQVAMQMAHCVMAAPGCGTTGFDPSACRATGCVPTDVTVRVESFALAGR